MAARKADLAPKRLLTPSPSPRRRPHPAQVARPAPGVRRRPGFAAHLREGLLDDLTAACEAIGKNGSGGRLHSAAIIMVSEYHRDGADRGWTPTRFYSALGGALAAAKGGAGERTLRKYGGLLFAAGLFVSRRAGRHPVGRLERIYLSLDRMLDGGDRVATRGGAKRARAAERMRRVRARKRNDVASQRAILPPILPAELDEIDDELARIGKSIGPASGVPADAEPVRPIEKGGASPMKTVGLGLPDLEKQIPQSPTPPAQGPVDLGVGAEKAAEGPLASAEALEARLWRFVSRQRLEEAEKLRQEVGAPIYQALRAAHPSGLAGLKREVTAEEARRACQRVARAHAPRPRTSRERCARLRAEVDRRAAAAPLQEVERSLAAALGPSASGVRARSVAAVGLPTDLNDLVLERVCRQLKVGSAGPTRLQHPRALASYVLTALRRESSRRPRGHGGPAQPREDL